MKWIFLSQLKRANLLGYIAGRAELLSAGLILVLSHYSFSGELRCVIPDYWSLEDFRVVKGMYPVINSGQSVLIECLKPSRWESGRMELNCNDGILAPDFICGSR